MTRPAVLTLLVFLALCGGALAYWSLGRAESVEEPAAALPAYEEGEACESCSLRHQRLQRERTWTD